MESLEVRWCGAFGTVVGGSGRLYGGIRRREYGVEFHPTFDLAPWRKRGETWTAPDEAGALAMFARWASDGRPSVAVLW